mmetsp:Transcript_36517/g.66568  ORF Transcript_36517/g.66568 Transcript_36517/m.66568 type:complete len:236 (+) Transcript_36517:755-1462(+)
MYAGVPTHDEANAVLSSTREMPKSPMRMSLLRSHRKMLELLRSRCTTPWACKCARPASICRSHHSTTDSGSALRATCALATTPRKSPLSAKDITIMSTPADSCRKLSRYSIRFGWEAKPRRTLTSCLAAALPCASRPLRDTTFATYNGSGAAPAMPTSLTQKIWEWMEPLISLDTSKPLLRRDSVHIRWLMLRSIDTSHQAIYLLCTGAEERVGQCACEQGRSQRGYNWRRHCLM